MDSNLKLALVFFSSFFVLSSAAAATLSAESAALAAFRGSLQNPAVLSGWDPRLPVCSFPGVTCRGGTVAAVDLAGVPLGASLSSVASALLTLQSLESLSLSFGNVTGALSDAPRCGPRLRKLDLAGNGLAGSVADVALLAAACPALTSLNLSFNAIGGGPPAGEPLRLESVDLSYNKISSVSDVSFLLSSPEVNYLSLAGNQVSGGVTAIRNCSALSHLDLSANALSGEIRDGVFASCSKLEFLNLSSNHFTGSLPADISSLYSLEVVDLSKNNFSGDISADFFSPTLALKSIVLSFNNFSGRLPDSVSKLRKLVTLDLSSNGFSGSIPLSLCSESSVLEELYLQNNVFIGGIPDALSNCSMLFSLDLSFNYLTGAIPPSLGSLSHLKDLILWQNLLEGEIPPELSLVSSLENLILDNNGLTGSIPGGLKNCTNLNWVSMSSNHLTGEIPPWVGSLEKLAILKLSNNSFSGVIPPELGDCKSLIWLDLNSNNLRGRIPDTVSKQSGKIAVGLVTGKRFVYLKNDGSKECHGAGNLLEFVGIRPEELNRLPSRRSCNFTRIYSGSTEYTFKNNGSLIFLDLSYNQLEGEIPKELGNMYYLQVLNLGHNSLSGPIPPELGSLHNVAVFDLSHNSLEGNIPPSLSGLTLLSEIDLSNNKLNGTIPYGGQLALFPSFRYENNSGLCGFPLLVSCPKSSVTALSDNHQMSRHRQASIVASIAMALLFIVLCVFGVIIFVVENKKREKMKNSHNNHRDIYIDSRSHSGAANSNWMLTGTKEALVISLAAFDQKPLQKLTFADLLEATNGFHPDSLVGSGGFGDVFKAQLKDGSVVAIKKLIHISGQGEREFMAEMETIGKIKHRNLVPLLGYCKVGEERLLVYEYMKYGSLEDVLHDRKKAGIKLNWAARREIALGAARGLAFLHHNCIPHIIHRDMKSSNVLLDENLEARVSDFGMARMMSTVDTHLSVSTLAGTPGYVPPEYYQSFRCTTKGDVYSYGVVLLELLTGRLPTDSSDFGDNNLVGWVKQSSKFKISDVFDPVLLREDPSLELELLEHLKIACACLDDRPSRRPTMVTVMAKLKEIQAGSTVSSAVPDHTAGSFDAADMSLKEDKEDCKD